MAMNSKSYEQLAERLRRCIISRGYDVSDARKFVSSLGPDEVAAVTEQKLFGYGTLLYQAAWQNRWSFVKFLLDECHADVDQRCDTFQGRNVTALCRAGGLSDVRVVRLLVERGADINALPDDHCTPVHWASSEGCLSVVRYLLAHGADINIPDIHGVTCLMVCMHNLELDHRLNICKLLICAGASVNAVDSFGDSALHHVFQDRLLVYWDIPIENVVEQVDLLLDHGADASVRNQIGDYVLRTAALYAASDTLEYLVGRLDPTPQERADIYAIHASCLVHWSRWGGLQELTKATQFYTKSMYFRTQTSQAEPTADPHPFFNGAVEVFDVGSLEAISDDNDAMRVQAFLTCERILGRSHGETIHWLTENACHFLRSGDYEQGVKMYKYAFESCGPTSIHPLRSLDPHMNFLEMVRGIAEGEDDEEEEEGNGQERTVKFDDVAIVLQMMVKMSKCQPISQRCCDVRDVNEEILRLSNNVTELLCRLKPSAQQSLRLKQMLRALIQSKCETGDGSSILHLAFSELDHTVNGPVLTGDSLPSGALVKQLVDAGADVNAVNSAGDTPLHLAIAAHSVFGLQRTSWLFLIDLLLRHGAHVDTRNARGERACDRLPDSVDKSQFISLQCLAARAIRSHGLAYRHVLPTSLSNFVDLH